MKWRQATYQKKNSVNDSEDDPGSQKKNGGKDQEDMQEMFNKDLEESKNKQR